MSQAGINNTSSGPVPPSVPTSFVTDNGTAIPALNILNVLTNDTTANNDNGIQDTGSGNTITISLTNRATGLVTTTDATLTTLITLPLGATPGTFYVYGNVQAFNSATPSSGAYSFSGGFRTDGITATELGTEMHDEFEDPVLVTADIFISSTGNNILLSVQGVAATSINWGALMEYRRVI